MSIHTRFLDVIDQLNDGFGVRVGVESLDGKCAYSQELDHDQTKALCKAILGDSDASAYRTQRDDARARAEVQGLESISAELAAKVEALAAARSDLGKATDALGKARAETQEAKGGAEGADKRAAYWERDLRTEIDKRRTLQADYTRALDALHDHMLREKARTEVAEARVKVLEGSGVPALWARIYDDGAINTFPSEEEALGFGSIGVVEPLYRHPPKPAGEPVAWRVFYDKTDKFITSASYLAAAHGASDAAVTPLYEAPPVALGVDVSEIRTLIEHGKQGCYDLSSFVIVLGNMLGKLPTVDVAAIRKALATLRSVRIWTCEDMQRGADAFTLIESAIGEKI